MSGTIQKPCDRCTDLMDIPVDITHQIICKFGEEESEDENLIVLPPSAFTIDVASDLYELLTVALPSRTVHKEDECNEEMLDLIDQYVDSSENEEEDSDEEDIDPRWNELKNLNKKLKYKVKWHIQKEERRQQEETKDEHTKKQLLRM